MPETGSEHATSGKPEPVSTDQSFPRSRRLLNAADFNSVFAEANVRAGTGELFVLARKVPAGEQRHCPRIGFIVARKNVRKAVRRNLIKRIVREEFRRLHPDYPSLDIIFMARRGADRLSRETIHEATRYLFRKLRQRHLEQSKG